MHFALSESKRLLHYGADYAFRMGSPNERLRQARIKAGYDTAKDAAEAMGVPVSTYIGHENGHRGFPAKRVPQYARKFKVSDCWLLYGKGDADEASPFPSADLIQQMLQEVVNDEVTLGTKPGDLPRILAPALHEQLERFRADAEAQGNLGTKNARSKGVQSLSSTTPDA